jgi:hypothetical protein
MHGPAESAISVLLYGLTCLMIFGAGSQWAKLARDTERTDERPTIPVNAFRHAASLTAAAFMFLGLSVLWLALSALPWGS